ncbi:glycosyltransferase family 1 protein [Aulographum hederae CBS 113979]|uniref:sterol 3beta-glucosyltransferase n=1 Tax=Aulographum hederae CBS 113979 TaxID=1176131 RepID=A0A6G1GYB3_9PEZI|nr:glycosyltransferase family 1 protein [Aulographum hederae CBS 113979]
MASEDGLRERLGRKLTKQRAGGRRISMDLPDRFQDGDDAEEDVTAPKTGKGIYGQQSLFSLIAAAGSSTNVLSKLNESDEESDDDEKSPTITQSMVSPGQPAQSARISKGKLSKGSLLQSLPKLRLRSSKEKSESPEIDPMSSSQILPPRPPQTEQALSTVSPEPPPSRDAPVLSRMIKARAEMEGMDVADANTKVEEASEETKDEKSHEKLALTLMDIFGFEEPETVITEYPCWLLQTVLLQGYMYITEKHICFYAYLPRKDSIVIKSGYLSKRGRQTSRYKRSWYQLQGDVLSYNQSQTEKYYRDGHIDLRYGISATLDKEKGKDSATFTVLTDKKSYHFKADSVASAKEWVRNLQKVIFRSHNDGDSVKISLPIANVIDFEQTPVISMDFADTVKIRVIDNDETFAIDEYFFSFFGFTEDALAVLRIMVEGDDHETAENESQPETHDRESSPHRASQEQSSRRGRVSLSPLDALPNREPVRATLQPFSPPGARRSSSKISIDSGSSPGGSRRSFDVSRRSFDASPRRSTDFGRASLDRGRHMFTTHRSPSHSADRLGNRSPVSGVPEDSSGSTDHSFAPDTESSAAVQSIDESNISASQILNRSDVFQNPTIRQATYGDASDPMHRESIDTARSAKNGQSHASSAKRPNAEADRAKATTPSTVDTEQDCKPRPAQVQHAGSSSTLRDLMRAGAYPLKRASGLAGLFTSRSQRMSKLLASESMGYYEKVSGMWAGGAKHYGATDGIAPDDQVLSYEDDVDASLHAERFRAHFALPESEKLRAAFYGNIHKVLPLYGKIYLGTKHFCFRSLLPGTKTKIVIPFSDIENVVKERGYRFAHFALVVVIRGHEELFFDFSQAAVRDDCTITLLKIIETSHRMESEPQVGSEAAAEAEAAKEENELLRKARQDGHAEHDLQLPHELGRSGADAPPIMFDDPRASIINFKPTESLRITCLTIGSRGDVQPYIALCKKLKEEGHRPKIATHEEFGPWVEKHGIEFVSIGGDPAELMKICVEYGMFTVQFVKEASARFRGWIDELCESAWQACQETDLLIESPSAMVGIHIAEALEIPYFRAFTMPWTRTRAYPHAFAVPERKLGGAYNYMTYVVFDNFFWAAIANQINKWRNRSLGLPGTSFDKMQANKIPFLYNFSPSVVAPPIDYSDWIRVTGYWFLDEGAGDYIPPPEMADFIKRARDDGKKLVYVGFGSIVVDDPVALTKTVVDSVLKADVRCILSKGWSDRLDVKDPSKAEVPLPPEVLQIKSAPHDWLFRQIDAAVHHGGAGTTGASLRAGIPTIIKPFFGDQWFFGSRVEDIGVGICMKKLNTSVFARSLWEATRSERMIVKARVLGEEIRKEDGVNNAVQAIYRDLEYAKSLIKHRKKQHEDNAEDTEETWTFIGDESDPDLRRQIEEWDPHALIQQQQQQKEQLKVELGTGRRK